MKTSDRRAFLTAVGLGVPGLTVRGLASQAPAVTRTGASAARTSMRLVYTSFAVRMLQGRDIMQTTAAALGPDVFLDLCVRFGAAGGQMDLSQLGSGEASALAVVREAFAAKHVALEVSIPARALETPEGFAAAVAVARALGATRGRVALLSGRRYETFETAAAWAAFVERWRTTLIGMRREFDRHAFAIGIENHKDWLAPELADLVGAIGSPHVGVCLDFGNNLALLEDPDETIDVLAPLAVTTHLKDMAVRPTDDGFALAEVPLGQGLLPLERYVGIIGRARPETPFCLEMITRDPLPVPYRTDRYWIPFEASARREERVRAFEARVLARAAARPLPRVSGLLPAAQVAAEDDNVRASVDYARDVLKLEAD